jgi:predicted  nucleic acid-binding Zn-ribbon protein
MANERETLIQRAQEVDDCFRDVEKDFEGLRQKISALSDLVKELDPELDRELTTPILELSYSCKNGVNLVQDARCYTDSVLNRLKGFAMEVVDD